MRRLLLAFAASLLAISPAHATPRGWDNIGPVGGEFRAIAADPTDAGRVIVFSAETLFQTRDGGATWQQSPTPCPEIYLSTPVLSGAEVRGGALYVNCRSQLMRSGDGGVTWQQFSKYSGSDGSYQEMRVHPFIRGTVFASRRAAGDDVEATSDDGASWLSTDDVVGVGIRSRATFDPRSSTRLLAISTYVVGANKQTGSLIERTTFSTGQWTPVSTVFEGATNNCFGSDLAIDGVGTVYLATECAIFVSRDDGRSWEQHDLPEVSSTFSVSKMQVASQRAGHAAMRSRTRVMVTDDGGSTWSTLVSGIPVDMAMAADGAIFTTEGGRVYRYDSRGRVPMPVELRAAGASYLAVAGDVLLVNTGSQAMRSTNGGLTWSPFPGDAAGILYVVPVAGQPSSLYGRVFNRTWFSRDAGASWEQVPVPDPPQGYNNLAFASPVGPQPGVIYGAWESVSNLGAGIIAAAAIRSTDGGRTWNSIDAGLIGTSRSIVGAPSDVSTAYARTSTGLFRTRDAGATWRLVWSTAERGSPSTLSLDYGDAQVVYLVAADGNIWATEDGGDQWRATAVPTPSDHVSALIPDPVDSLRAFALTGNGDVFETRDAARSWTRLSVGARPSHLATPLLVAVRGSARSIVATNTETVLSLDLSKPHPIALGTDLWWNAAQPGWGLSLVQHDNYQMFAIWFTYDAQGKPTWRFIPGGTWVDANTFTGTLYVSSVASRDFFASSAFVAPTVTPVGSATLRFTSPDVGDATFTVGERTIHQPITRMAFGPVDKTQAGLADLWFNPSQSGWGFAMHQQYSNVFATWFLYNDDGSPTWLLMPDAKTQGGNMSGDVYRATGSVGTPYEAHGVALSKAGTASFTGTSTLGATIDGKEWTSPISRLPF